MQNQIQTFLSRFSAQQKILVAGVAAFIVIGMVVLLTSVHTTDYGVLYANLNPQDASNIVNRLRDNNIRYQLDDGGKTILVSNAEIYELRLRFAGEGLPQMSAIGYEIFDRSNLGISDFVQKVHYRRAIEGELARTILQLEEVEGARVHIVVPERTLFREDQKPATASVVLKLRNDGQIGVGSIRSIMHLVASSIEGLKADNVTVVDSRGTLLSDDTKRDALATMTTTQYEMQRQVEDYLRKKAQSLLEGIVGRGNAIVQVNTELDFRQVERTLELYDADSPVVRSEQLTEERSVSNAETPPSTLTNSVTNYEINRTLERIVENRGGVQRMSVAAIVNGRSRIVERDGDRVSEYIPRSAEEMDQLTDVVARAVGYNPQRNDEISVVNLPFGETMEDRDLLYEETPLTDWYPILEKVLLAFAMLAALFILRSLLNKFGRNVRSVDIDNDVYVTNPAAEELIARKKRVVNLPSPDEELDEEVMVRSEKKKRVADYVTRKPDEAARLLKVWLQED
jgi:flagellar M-ring protein FliF